MSNATPDLAQLRVAVVGLGSIGNRHLNNLRELGVRNCTVVRRAESTNQQFQPPPDVQVVTDAQAAIASGIDAAIICTPSSRHKVAAEPFLQARVPVLIEKPLEASLFAAREIESLAKAHNVYASVAYCMRYHPAFRAAADFLSSGKLGEVLSAKAWFHTYLPDWHPYEDYRQSYAARADLGGGVIPTLDHEIDFLLWTLGPAELESAQLTSGRDTLGIDVPAAAELTLLHSPQHQAAPNAAADFHENLTAGQASSGTLPNTKGTRAEISLSYANREFSRGFEFHGSTGCLSFSFASGEMTFLPISEPNKPEGVATSDSNDTSAMYFHLLQNVLQEIATGQPPSTPLTSGIAALEICERAIASSGTA